MTAHRLYHKFKANGTPERTIDCLGIACYVDRCPFWTRGTEPHMITCAAAALREQGMGPEILLDELVYILSMERIGTPRNAWEEEEG